jgi:DNA polymerase III epsilon subunit-like protein
MIVIDLEMSGIYPDKHSILSIGAVDFSNPKNQFYMECRLRENASYMKEALAVNGFKPKQIRDKAKPSLKHMLLEFIKWADGIKDKTIAGHNVQFDMMFLKHSFRLYHIKYSIGNKCVDTHALTYAHCHGQGIPIPLKYGRSNITSEFVASYCGLPKEPSPHNGLNGARIEAEELSRLIHGKSLLKEYKRFKIPKYLIK